MENYEKEIALEYLEKRLSALQDEHSEAAAKGYGSIMYLSTHRNFSNRIGFLQEEIEVLREDIDEG